MVLRLGRIDVRLAGRDGGKAWRLCRQVLEEGQMKSHSQMMDMILHSGYAAYLNACSKHPFFCDRICCDSTDWAGLAKDTKEHIQFHAERKDGNCTARDVINAELCEVYEAFIRGAHARRELMDAFAVLMRMDDMLRAVDGKDAQPPLEEDCRQTDDFTYLVKEMRTMQKAFFRTREVSTLQASKHLESEVDRRIADIEQE